MSSISTHVLDTATGRPAAGLEVRLEVERGGRFELVGLRITDAQGRVQSFGDGSPMPLGTYRLHFDTDTYLRASDVAASLAGGPARFDRAASAADPREPFYPYVDIVFRVSEPSAHYHVPLLLSPFGYASYRGS